jgi:integrase
MESLFPQDFSNAVLTSRTYTDAKLPDVLSDKEVESLLASVDRSTHFGKRNYAIMLLALRYGLRPCDIRNLSFENIRWREGLLSLTQAKTASPLVLPLLEDVALALIDYIKNGRPATDSRRIFVRHVIPCEPFCGRCDLSHIMRKPLARAGLSRRRGTKGLYVFRRSLATRLLREGNSTKTIADVLGHSDIRSVMIYTKIDFNELRTVAISIKEVLS